MRAHSPASPSHVQACVWMQAFFLPHACASALVCARPRSHTRTRTPTHARADPAAEEFKYPVSIDVRDLITLDDVMQELDLGPNGCGWGRPWPCCRPALMRAARARGCGLRSRVVRPTPFFRNARAALAHARSLHPRATRRSLTRARGTRARSPPISRGAPAAGCCTAWSSWRTAWTTGWPRSWRCARVFGLLERSSTCARARARALRALCLSASL